MYKIKSLTLVALALLFGGIFVSAEAQKKQVMRPLPIAPPPLVATALAQKKQILKPLPIDPPPFVGTALSGTYSIEVNANEVSTGEAERTTGATYGWTWYGNTEGDLSGYMFVSLNYATDNTFAGEVNPGGISGVTGGSWSKLIFENGVYVGSIFGKITGGELVRNNFDRMATISLTLTADEGTGPYVGSIGSGTFEGLLDRKSKAASVTGKLTLTY
jgi:hypothetical protein